MQTFRTFTTAKEAREYRHEHGTGGWILEPDVGPVILFRPEMTPSQIFRHELARGKTGNLIRVIPLANKPDNLKRDEMLRITEYPHRGPSRIWETESKESFCQTIVRAYPRADINPNWSFDRMVSWLGSDLRDLEIEELR